MDKKELRAMLGGVVTAMLEEADKATEEFRDKFDSDDPSDVMAKAIIDAGVPICAAMKATTQSMVDNEQAVNPVIATIFMELFRRWSDEINHLYLYYQLRESGEMP